MIQHVIIIVLIAILSFPNCKSSTESIDASEEAQSGILPDGKQIPSDIPLQPRFFLGKSNYLGKSSITPENIRQRADDSNAFHFVLAHALDITRTEENSIFSGYSVQTAFALLYPATAAGSTVASEMAAGLVFDTDLEYFYETTRSHILAVADAFSKSSPQQNIKLSLVNQIWIDRNYWANKDFTEILKQQFNAGVAALPLQNLPDLSVKSINRFVDHNTMGVVKDLLPAEAITPSTSVVLTNAIAMSADWDLPFDSTKTVTGDFLNADGSTTQTQFMMQTSAFDYYESARYQALSMNYVGGKVAMLVVLPRSRSFFSDFSFTFDAVEFRTILTKLSKKIVGVRFPRFEFEWHGDVTEGLKARGIKKIFEEKINNLPNLLFKDHKPINPLIGLSAIHHKAKITVTEQSTQPGATSAITEILVGTNAVKQEFEFSVDHPALFFIYEKPHGTILFGGQLTTL